MTTRIRRGGLVQAAANALRTPPDKIPQVTTDPRVATAPEPTAAAGIGQTKTEVGTRLLSAPLVSGKPTEILYSGERLWSRVTVELKTAGPVAVGTSPDLAPVTSGKGQLLNTDQPVTFEIARGVSLYVAVTTLNRIDLTVEPVPWLEQITALLRAVAQGVVALASGKEGA